MYKDRLNSIIDLSFNCLYEKINGGLITIENEASLQLHLSLIMKSFGEQFIFRKNELFSIELEKPVVLSEGTFSKSNSLKARIDIFISIENIKTNEKTNCAIELKFFKESNHREPNNRYDVFKDIQNLENYGEFSNFGYLIVATDHEHYISHNKYSKNTADFDFRNDSKYKAHTKLEYGTTKPHGEPITLNYNYDFSWKTPVNGISFLLLEVNSTKKL
ncbi:MAG: hypothetical protein GQ570_14780 [Helicobacteraceae bacterium]|nr:hypothetical protein [Helicobacteraceae bacterium]